MAGKSASESNTAIPFFVITGSKSGELMLNVSVVSSVFTRQGGLGGVASGTTVVAGSWTTEDGVISVGSSVAVPICSKAGVVNVGIGSSS